MLLSRLQFDAKIEIEEKDLKSPVTTAMPVRRFPTPTMNPERPFLDVDFSNVFGNDDTDNPLPLAPEPAENDNAEIHAYQQNTDVETQQPTIDQEDTFDDDGRMPSEHRSGNTLRRPTMDMGGGMSSNIGIHKPPMAPRQRLRRPTMDLGGVDESGDQQMTAPDQALRRPNLGHGGFDCSEDADIHNKTSSQDNPGFDTVSSKPSQSVDTKNTEVEENSLEATFYSLINTEYRYLLNKSIYVHSILDFTFLENKISSQKNKLYGVGLGVGIITKAGLFRLIYANGKRDKQPFKVSNSKVHISLSAFF